ncbi:MAG: methylated-DNA--[protein]-cysteine S-methyltransferase [Actinomycetota bacterium]
MPRISYVSTASPIGDLRLVASPNGLRRIDLPPAGEPESTWVEESTPILTEVVRQLTEYFAGDRRTFDLPLEPEGTDFQLSVWKVLRAIPFGQTISYGEQARRLGDANKARAVGSANGRNPLPIVVPCHRVVGADGSLTGFSGGVDAKRWLLEYEGSLVGE